MKRTHGLDERDGTGEAADGRLPDNRRHSGKAEKAVCQDDRADARGRNGRTSRLREELRSRE